MHCFVTALNPGLAQKTGVNPQGRNSDHLAVDEMSVERTVISEFQSADAAGRLTQTETSRQAANEPAVQSRLSAGNPEPEMLDTAAEKGAGGQSTDVETMSSLGSSHAVTSAVVTGSILGRPSRLSNVQCPVKLNGISNSDKSDDTCSGTCC